MNVLTQPHPVEVKVTIHWNARSLQEGWIQKNEMICMKAQESVCLLSGPRFWRLMQSFAYLV